MIVIKNSGLRAALRILIPFIAIPALVLIGVYVFEDKMYAYISLVITILAIVLFISGFEQRKIGTRRMVLVVVLTVMSVVGRFIPLIKPVTAITVIAGIY
ncbi:MAG: ECF transporter S component, partial [Lachnospiraceae bacterium]|nr:ECF transporter S component [Lachnospiraceae bacterium]